ncbi:hypothetical protein KQX54_010840 [Cotesia glomerata]|uniref:Uncharacterized protein n=1 Tax=Cotesia glomerata TaxID=32391 RepID=A0AAV7HSB3_COTGL|nr:hypothetical protein KQX54_010840 [Cotesia glomerata]
MSYDEEYRKFYFGELRRELADSEPYAGESPESFYYYLRGLIIQLGEYASPLTREVIVRTLHQNLGRHVVSFFPPDLQGQVTKFNTKTLDETYLAFKQVTSASTSPPSIQQEQKIQAAQISVEEQPEENAEEINCQELINNQEATQTEVEPIFENFWDNCEISIVTVFTPVICLEPYCDTVSELDIEKLESRNCIPFSDSCHSPEILLNPKIIYESSEPAINPNDFLTDLKFVPEPKISQKRSIQSSFDEIKSYGIDPLRVPNILQLFYSKKPKNFKLYILRRKTDVNKNTKFKFHIFALLLAPSKPPKSSCSNNMSNYINSTSASNVDSIHRKLLNGMRLLSFHGAYEFLTHYTKGNFLEQKVFKTQEDTLPVTNLISNGLKFIRQP